MPASCCRWQSVPSWWGLRFTAPAVAGSPPNLLATRHIARRPRAHNPSNFPTWSRRGTWSHSLGRLAGLYHSIFGGGWEAPGGWGGECTEVPRWESSRSLGMSRWHCIICILCSNLTRLSSLENPRRVGEQLKLPAGMQKTRRRHAQQPSGAIMQGRPLGRVLCTLSS